MKFVLRIFALLFISILIAFVGSSFNAVMYAKVADKKIIQKAQLKYDDFIKHYDPNKKIIVVIGTSTSIFSFAEGDSHLKEVSYADLLKDKANVVNFSAVDISDISQVKALINFTNDKIPNADLIILENLRYFRPIKIFENYSELDLSMFCAKELLLNSFTSENVSKYRKYYVSQCHKIKERIIMASKAVSFVTNPCLKKYQEGLNSILYQHPPEQVEFFSKVLSCNKGVFTSDEVPLELAVDFQYGNLQVLQKAFGHAGEDIYKWTEDYETLEFEEPDMVYINRYLVEFLDNNEKNKFFIIPIFSKLNKSMKNLPVFNVMGSRAKYVDIADEILKTKKEKQLRNSDVFLDGAHSKYWVHQILANKVVQMFENNSGKK